MGDPGEPGVTSSEQFVLLCFDFCLIYDALILS